MFVCFVMQSREEGIGEMRAPLVSRRVINFEIRVFMTSRAACVSMYMAGMLSNSSSVSDIQKYVFHHCSSFYSLQRHACVSGRFIP